MSSARYLVTGGAGFIGSHIAATLLKQGEAVRVLDNYATGRVLNQQAFENLPGQVEIVQADIRDREAVQKACQGIEVVFHQAALASVPRSIADPVSSLEVNVNGTQNVLLAARDAAVRRVVFASSSSVYGDTLTLPKHEGMPTVPLSPYAVHKLTGELLCGVFTRIYGLETVALRYFNVFGPRQDPKSEYAAVIPRFLTALLTKEQPVIFGDGEQTRDFTFVENVVQANLKAANAPHASGQAINIGCGHRVSLNTMLHTASQILKTKVPVNYHPARSGDVRDSLADIHKARQLLGYEPEIDFAEGLVRTIHALQARP